MKKLFLALPLALAAGSVFAADPIEKQVLITATVPTASFFVEPVGGNWMNDPQNMAWNPHMETLSPIRKQLEAKSTVGPITAHLLTPAVVTSGGNSIDLNVKVGNFDLTTSPVEILSDAQANAGAIVDFVVTAVKPAAGYTPGNYQGLVNMMFETTL